VQSYIRPFNVPPSTFVLLLFDATMLGGSEDGFCLTEDAIYWHNAWEEMRYFQKYSSITEIRVVDSKVIVNSREILGLGTMVPLVQKILFLLNGLYERHLNCGTQAAKPSDSEVQHFNGTCRNTTVGMQGALSLVFAPVTNAANNSLMNIGGFIELFGLGGSGQIEGTLNKTEILFASMDRPNGFRVEWSGTVTGKLVGGTYNVVPLNGGKRTVQSGTWQAEWFEK
jgi:hypothetical protein